MDEPPVPKRDLLLPRHSKKNSVSYCGWMEKHTGMTNDWSRRWFSLEAGTLSYYYDKSDRVPKASIPLSSYTVHEGDDELKRRHCIVLKPIFPGDIEYRFCCESPFSHRTWMAKLSAGSHKGRIKFVCVGSDGCGKTKLIDSFFYDTQRDCDLKGSYPSVGSHVGYIPAPNTHRKDILVTVGEQGEQLVSVESVESPGKGDFAHIRELLYNGTDVIMAVFSLADSVSLDWLERMLKTEVIKRVDGAPLVLVGTKKDLRDSRLPRPVVGHSSPGSRGHLAPMQRQEFNCVTTADAEERARALGAAHYFEVDGFDNTRHEEILHAITLCGLEHRRPR